MTDSIGVTAPSLPSRDRRTRLLRWVASARGAPLAIFMVVAYAQSHRLILLVFAVGILAIAINELVGAYQHRSETRSE